MPKISELTTLTQASDGDYYPIVDDSGNVTKKVAANKINPPASVVPSMRSGGYAAGTLNANTATVNVTGLGFKPKLIQFFMFNSSTSAAINGYGVATSTSNQWGSSSAFSGSSGGSTFSTTNSVLRATVGTTTPTVAGAVSDINDDGFVVSISTTGNVTYGWVAMA